MDQRQQQQQQQRQENTQERNAPLTIAQVKERLSRQEPDEDGGVPFSFPAQPANRLRVFIEHNGVETQHYVNPSSYYSDINAIYNSLYGTDNYLYQINIKRGEKSSKPVPTTSNKNDLNVSIVLGSDNRPVVRRKGTPRALSAPQQRAYIRNRLDMVSHDPTMSLSERQRQIYQKAAAEASDIAYQYDRSTGVQLKSNINKRDLDTQIFIDQITLVFESDDDEAMKPLAMKMILNADLEEAFMHWVHTQWELRRVYLIWYNEFKRHVELTKEHARDSKKAGDSDADSKEAAFANIPIDPEGDIEWAECEICNKMRVVKWKLDENEPFRCGHRAMDYRGMPDYSKLQSLLMRLDYQNMTHEEIDKLQETLCAMPEEGEDAADDRTALHTSVQVENDVHIDNLMAEDAERDEEDAARAFFNPDKKRSIKQVKGVTPEQPNKRPRTTEDEAKDNEDNEDNEDDDETKNDDEDDDASSQASEEQRQFDVNPLIIPMKSEAQLRQIQHDTEYVKLLDLKDEASTPEERTQIQGQIESLLQQLNNIVSDAGPVFDEPDDNDEFEEPADNIEFGEPADN